MSVHARARSRIRGRAALDELLRPLDIQIDGDRPFDPQVHNGAFYSQALPRGIKGILDAYVAGWWDCERLDELVYRVLSGRIALADSAGVSFLAHVLLGRLLNRQTRTRSLHIHRHYNLGNDLFAAMLDRRMNYSCGYWKNAADLDEAQEAKLDLICRKVGLESGMRVLDVGCGWGGFVRFAAEKYGVSAVGITLSQTQVELGRTLCNGLPIELRVQDYRDLGDETFDAVVSIGMFEHVGHKNYRLFMKIMRRCLKPDGLFLLHTIGNPATTTSTSPWIEQNIFPNSMLPSAKQIAAAGEGLMVLEDWHSFGADYDRTLMAWHRNFEAAWSQLRASYDERFHRMWRCYLLTCAGSFRARDNQLWQIVFSPSGVPGGYRSIR